MPMLGRFTSTTLSKIEPCVHGVIKVSFVTSKGCNCLEINFPENVFFFYCHLTLLSSMLSKDCRKKDVIRDIPNLERSSRL